MDLAAYATMEEPRAVEPFQLQLKGGKGSPTLMVSIRSHWVKDVNDDDDGSEGSDVSDMSRVSH